MYRNQKNNNLLNSIREKFSLAPNEIEKVVEQIELKVKEDSHISIPYILYQLLLKLDNHKSDLKIYIAYALIDNKGYRYFYKTDRNLFYIGYGYEILYYEIYRRILENDDDNNQVFEMNNLMAKLYKKSLEYYQDSIDINEENLKLCNYLSGPFIQKLKLELFSHKINLNTAKERMNHLIANIELNNLVGDRHLTYNQRGEILCELGDYSSALSDFKQSLQMNPNQSNIYNTIGKIHEILGNLEIAKRNYNQSITGKNSSFSDTYYRKCFNYLDSIRKKDFKYSNRNYDEITENDEFKNIFGQIYLSSVSAETLEKFIHLYLLFNDKIDYFFQGIFLDKMLLTPTAIQKNINKFFSLYSKKELCKVRVDLMLIKIVTESDDDFLKKVFQDKYDNLVLQLDDSLVERTSEELFKFFWKKQPTYVKEYFSAAKYFMIILQKLLDNLSNIKITNKEKKVTLQFKVDYLMKIIKKFLGSIDQLNVNHKDGQLLEIELLEIEYYLSFNNNTQGQQNNNAIANKILRKLNKLTTNYPNCDISYKEKGDMYTILGNYESAMDNYLLAENIHGGDYSLFNRRGNLYYILKNYELAVGDYKSSIRRKKDYIWPYLSLIKIYQYNIEEDNFYKEVERLIDVIKKHKIKDDSMKYICRVIMENPHQIKLVKYTNHNRMIADELLSFLSQSAKTYDNSITLLEKLYLTIKDKKEFYFLYQKFRIAIYLKHKNNNQSMTNKFLEDYNYNETILEIEDKYLLKDFKTEDLTKISFYRKLIEFKLSFPSAYIGENKTIKNSPLLNFLFGITNKEEEKTKEFLLKLEKVTLNIIDYLELGIIYYMLGYYEISLDKINRYIEKNNRDNKALTYRSLCYISLKKYTFSMLDLKRSLEINDKYYKTYVGLILCTIHTLKNQWNEQSYRNLIEYIMKYLNYCPKMKTDNTFYQVDNILKEYTFDVPEEESLNDLLEDQRLKKLFRNNEIEYNCQYFYQEKKFIQWISRF